MSPNDNPEVQGTLPEPRRSSAPGEIPGPDGTTPPDVPDATAAHVPTDEVGTVAQVVRPTFLVNPEWPAVAGHEITGEIAKGGMGIVYAARDLALQREVAIKTLLPELAGHTHLAEQFDREARITAQLPHPGVPPVHAIGTLPDGRPFLVMKLIRGRTLDAELRAVDRVATLPRLLGVFEQICQTVGYAHSVGIIHRDLKPLNVMVGAFGEVQVMDWGIARSLANPDRERVGNDAETVDSDATRAGSAKGTPAFMPPEQARGEWDKVDARADVFALGGILCVLLTGKPAYTGADGRAIFQQAQAGDLVEVLARLDACGAEVELISLCKRCLAPKAEDRPTNGKAVADEIASYRAGVEARLRKAETERAEVAVRVEEERKRRKVRRWLFATVTLLLICGTGFGWWVDHQANQRKLDLERADGVLRAEQATFDAERKFKTDQAREQATTLLVMAVELRGQYRFARAIDALTQAAELAAVAPDLLPRIEQAKFDLAFVVEIDAIRMRRSTWIPDPEWEGKSRRSRGKFNSAGAPEAYRKAFGSRGLDVVADPITVGDRVAASAVRTDLVTALDDWAILEPDTALRDKVLTAVRRADPDSGASLFRDPAVWNDPLKLAVWGMLTDPARMSPGAVVAVAELMRFRRLDAAPFLRHALALYPRDFLIAHSLALVLDHHERPNRNQDIPECLGAYRAARSIREDNASVLNNLGILLRMTGDMEGAIAVHREAIRLKPEYPHPYFNMADTFHANGDSANAIATIKQFLRLYPKDAEAHDKLGQFLCASGDSDGCFAAHREAIRLDPKNAPAHYHLGVALRDARHFDDAVAAFKVCIQLEPDRADCHNALGSALRDKGDPDGAIASFKETLRLDPNNAKAHYNMGVAFGDKKELDAEIAAYKEAIRLDPKFAPAHSNLGLAFGRKGDLDGAISAFKEAVRQDPKLIEGHINLGHTLRGKGDFEAALMAYTEANRLKPIPYSLGTIYHDLERYPEAIEAAREAIRLNPKDANAHALLGLSLQYTGDRVGTRAALTEAARLDSKQWGPILKQLPLLAVAPPPREVGAVLAKNAATYFDEAAALLAKGHLDGAIAAYREAIKLDAKFVAAHINLGAALGTKGDNEGAIAAFKEAIRLDSKISGTHFNLGVVLQKSGDLPKAIAAYRESARLDPTDSKTHHHLATALSEAGDLPNAIGAYKEVVRLIPKNSNAHNNLGFALKRSGDLPGAIAAYKEAIRFDPQNLRAYVNLASAYTDSGDFPSASAAFKETIRIDPKNAVFHSSLAAVYGRQKMYPEAIAAAREAIRLNPKFAHAYAMLGVALRDSGDVAGGRVAYAEATRLDPKKYEPLFQKEFPLDLAPPPREVKP